MRSLPFFSLFFVAVISTMAINNLQKKGFISSYNSKSQAITRVVSAETQGRKRESETVKGCGFLSCCLWLLSFLSYTNSLIMLPTIDWIFLYQIPINNRHHKLPDQFDGGNSSICDSLLRCN